MSIFKKKDLEEAELIMGVGQVNKEALAELCNGLGEDEDAEKLMGIARQRTEVVGANANNNKIFSSLCCKIIPSPNYNPRSDAAAYGVKNNKIDTITIHHMAGNLTVETCGNIFANPSRGGSSNYGIGTDGRIAGYVGEENRAWTSSSKYNDFRAITIEVANNTLAPTWTVSQEALTSLYNLLVDVCKRNGIQRLIYSDNKNDRVNHVNGCNVTIHSDFAATACCGPYLKEIMADICTVVNNLLGANPQPQPQPTPTPTPAPAPVVPNGTPDPYADYSKATWDYFRLLGMTEYGCAGILGNLACESGIRPNNLQNSFEKKLGMTDDQYTAAVDNGTYKNFVKDGAGYGLAQWTYYTRKQALLNFAKQCKMSICDINLQLTYLYNELTTKYKGVWDGLLNARSVFEASNVMLLQFEKPADQSTANQQKRADCCQGYYDKFHGSSVTTTFPISAAVVKMSAEQPVGVSNEESSKEVEPYKVKITAQLLNVRKGAGMDCPIHTSIKKNGEAVIIAEKNGWGELEDKSGWIDLRYTKRI